MGVRPPANDDEDEPASVAFGIAAVDERLDDHDLSYPATAADVREAVGHVEVPYDTRGHTVRIAEVVEACGRDEFDDEQDLLNALHPEFERRRQQGGGFFERVRRVLPF